jgi:hypothetical protein
MDKTHTCTIFTPKPNLIQEDFEALNENLQLSCHATTKIAGKRSIADSMKNSPGCTYILYWGSCETSILIDMGKMSKPSPRLDMFAEGTGFENSIGNNG